MTPERARQIALACADSWYGGAAGMNLKEAITQGIMEALAEDARGKEKLDALRIALGAPEPTQEPVAWQLVTPKGLKEEWISMLPPTDDLEWRPLYAHGVAGDERRHVICLCPDCAHPAPAQTPMSDDQIMATASHFFDSPRWPSTAIDLARAVERHHGISS